MKSGVPLDTNEAYASSSSVFHCFTRVSRYTVLWRYMECDNGVGGDINTWGRSSYTKAYSYEENTHWGQPSPSHICYNWNAILEKGRGDGVNSPLIQKVCTLYLHECTYTLLEEEGDVDLLRAGMLPILDTLHVHTHHYYTTNLFRERFQTTNESRPEVSKQRSVDLFQTLFSTGIHTHI